MFEFTNLYVQTPASSEPLLERQVKARQLVRFGLAIGAPQRVRRA
jgi:hypothetical protein